MYHKNKPARDKKAATFQTFFFCSMCDTDCNNPPADCSALLLQAREEIVRRILALDCDCNDAPCSLADLADVAQQLANSCPRSSSAEYLAAFGAVRHGQLGNIDLRVTELAALLLDGQCCGGAGMLSDLHTKTLDDLCTRGDLVSLAALLQTAVKQADLARSVHRMDERELVRALDDADEQLQCERRLQACRDHARRTKTSWNDPPVDPDDCPSMRCTRTQLCDACARARRRRQTGRRFLDKYLHENYTPFGTDAQRGRGGSAEDEDEGRAVREAEQWAAQLRTLAQIAHRMRDVIEHTRAEMRRMHVRTLSLLEHAQYVDADGHAVTAPSSEALFAAAASSAPGSVTLDAFRADTKRRLRDLHNYAHLQSSNRTGALRQHYYINTYRSLRAPCDVLDQQAAFFHLAHQNAEATALEAAREAIECLGHVTGTEDALLAALAYVDIARCV